MYDIFNKSIDLTVVLFSSLTHHVNLSSVLGDGNSQHQSVGGL